MKERETKLKEGARFQQEVLYPQILQAVALLRGLGEVVIQKEVYVQPTPEGMTKKDHAFLTLS